MHLIRADGTRGKVRSRVASARTQIWVPANCDCDEVCVHYPACLHNPIWDSLGSPPSASFQQKGSFACSKAIPRLQWWGSNM